MAYKFTILITFLWVPHFLTLGYWSFVNIMFSKICSIYNAVKDTINLAYQGIINSPTWYKEKNRMFIHYYAEIKYKILHIKETNLALGLEHLHKNNLNDAILRFKLVEKFFDPHNSEASYFLGWTYFLKNNYPKALYYLEKAGKSDSVKLGKFLRNYQNLPEMLHEIPQEIWCQYRDLIAYNYQNKFIKVGKLDLPHSFAQKTMSKITDLPDMYNILELGSNVGMVGYEVRKRFPDHFIFTAVENAQSMNKISALYYVNIYNQLMESSIPDFLAQNSNNYDIILCWNSLSFTKDLVKYFTLIYTITNKLGYFAFCLPIDKSVNFVTSFSLIRKEFIFTIKDIKEALNQTDFIIKSQEELMIEKNSNYYMVVCKKNN